MGAWLTALASGVLVADAGAVRGGVAVGDFGGNGHVCHVAVVVEDGRVGVDDYRLVAERGLGCEGKVGVDC